MKKPALPLHWSTRALERVSEVVDYLALHDAQAAEEWIEALFAKTERLGVLPRMGRLVPEIGREEIREVFFQQYHVIYKIKPERIEILTVRHMRRHFDPGDIEQ